jgi:dienelactone hydrolase
MDRTYIPIAHVSIAQYAKTNFASNTSLGKRIKHDVYSRGEGAPVVIIQELHGIGVETLQLADHLVAAGFQVVLPHLFGPLGRTQMMRNLARVFCMRREFRLFRSNQASPIVDWLKSLCSHVRDTSEAKGVGVIGMCLTGNFAISLMADDSVLAAVASQPSLPLLKQTELHMSAQDVQDVKQRIDLVGPMMTLRFEGDKLCTAEKFGCIDEAFNKLDNERIQIRTLPGNGHSVLTRDFVDQAGHPTREALDEVIAYFSRQLG